MEFAEELILLVFVLQAVYSLYQRITGGDQAKKAAELEAPPAADDQATWALMIDRARDQISHAEATAERLRSRAITLRDRLGDRLGADRNEPLKEAVALRLLPALDRLRERLADLAAHLDDLDERPEQVAQWIARSGELVAIFGELGDREAHLGLVNGAARWQRDADLAALLREAEAVAAALLHPLTVADRRWPTRRPLCLPAPRADLDLGLDLDALFGDRPAVLLPPAFADESTRWPTLIEATARALVRLRPSLLDGSRALLPGDERPWLPRLQGRAVTLDLDALGRVWLPTLAADALAVMMMGPAALRGAMHLLASPDDPDEVVTVQAATDHRLADATPPPHLRVVLMARTLARMGADPRAARLLAQWQVAHGHPEALILPSLFGQSVRLPLAPVIERLGPVVDRLRDARQDALGGRMLSAVPGFEMSPSRWARVERRVELLVAGVPFQDDPVIAVAAAIMAADRSGGFGPRLSRALRHAIVAEGERRGPAAPVEWAAARFDDPLTARDLIEAIALRAVWRRPHPHPREPRRQIRG